MRFLLVIPAATAVTLGGVAYATQTTGTPDEGPRFTLTVTPARQAAAAGQAMTFAVQVDREPGFDQPITLQAVRLPRGSQAKWRHGHGLSILTVRTPRRAPRRELRMKVRATAGAHRRERLLVLQIERPRLRRFSLRLSPARATVAAGGKITLAVRIARVRGFNGRVKLELVSPPGVTGSWSRSARTGTLAAKAGLAIDVASDLLRGPVALTVRGTARVRGRFVRRHAIAVVDILEGRHFPIAADVHAPLSPGRREPIDLVLTNPYPFALSVISVSAVLLGTDRETCRADENFELTQYSGPYPLLIGPGSTPLSALVPDAAQWPQLSMHDLPINQDACKNARLTLEYDGIARR